MSRNLGVIRLVIVLVALLATVHLPVAAQDSTTCEDFQYQEDAQTAWDAGEGRPRADYMTGMDEDNDGIACEHLPSKPSFWQTIWFWVGTGIIAALTGGAIWWSRKVKAANEDRATDYLFPGRSSAEEVEDELALLKADRAIENDPPNQ